MSRSRWIVALGVLALLAALVVWQLARERRIAECLAAGGAWNGPASRCVPLPGSPILRRELERGDLVPGPQDRQPG